MDIKREKAIRIIVENENNYFTKEDRELLILNIWGLDETDADFYLLSNNLRNELLNYDEPQEDIMSPQYDALVKIVCETSYEQYTNEKLAQMVSRIVKQPVIITGENPIRYPCPCCGKETLSTQGEYDICSFCGWEDDGTKSEDKYSSANHMTLGEGKRNYMENIKN